MSSPQETPLTAFARPKDIRSDFEMQFGRHISMRASATITPAGIVSAGVAVAVMTLALGYVAGSLRPRR
jgi:hypothetical protein